MTAEKVGRYEIKAQIGKGGMATVFRAFDPRFKRDVAIKILPRQLMLDDPQFRARFVREAETIAALEHPAIVPVYDFGEEEGQPYLVMRLMPGGSLADRLREGPVSVQETAHILDRIGSALDRAHDHGIIHRDLKPGNILFDQYGDAYLADFGIARLTQGGETLTATGGLVGTPSYMSPEQIQGIPLDGRSDIYALGIIVFEMLTGKKPYEADTPAMMLVKQMTEPVPNALDVKPDLPPGCETVITKATAKEANQRYGRASEMAETLNTAVRNTPPTLKTPATDPTTPVAPLPDAAKTDTAVLNPTETAVPPSPPKSHRTLFIGGAAVGLVFILALILFLIFSPDENEPSTQANVPSATQSEVVNEPENIPAKATMPGEITNTAVADSPITTENIALLHRLGRGTSYAAELSSDGQQMAVGTSAGTWIYDAHTLELLSHLQGHRDIVAALAWSPDGSQIATGGWDNTMRLWDVSTGEQTGLIQGDDQFVAVAWSPDGNTIAASTWGSGVLLFDAATSRRTGELIGNENSILRLRFSPDGTWLASAENGDEATIRLWETGKGTEVASFIAHEGEITNITWSSDSTTLLSAGLSDSVVRAWDMTTDVGNQLFELVGHEYGVYDAAWSPDGSEIITAGGDNSLLAWDAENGRLTGTFADNDNAIIRIIPLTDSNQYIFFADIGTILIADAQNGQIALTQDEHTDRMNQVAWSPVASVVATANDDGTIRLWDGDNGEQIANWHAHDYGVYSIVWLPDGSRILSAGGDGALRLWDVNSQAVIDEWQPSQGTIILLALSPDGRLLAAADDSGNIWLLDSNLDEIQQNWQAHSVDITQVAWSPDNTTLATSSMNGAVTIWDAASGTEILSLPQQPLLVSDVVWSPDGTQLATASHDFTVRVWDALSGAELWQESHLELASSVAWSSNGRILASGGWDHTVRLWDAANGNRLDELNGHAGPVNTVAWSPDGNMLASGSDDGTAIIWGTSE